MTSLAELFSLTYLRLYDVNGRAFLIDLLEVYDVSGRAFLIDLLEVV